MTNLVYYIIYLQITSFYEVYYFKSKYQAINKVLFYGVLVTINTDIYLSLYQLVRHDGERVF